MIKILAIGGEPATGKSMLLREVRTKGKYGRFNKLRFELDVKKKIFWLGVFNGSKFEGTDKLSMAVQPDAIQFLEKIKVSSKYKNHLVVFEGDRLFTGTFLEFCRKNFHMKVIIVTARHHIKKARHVERADTQTDTFLKGRKTKIENIKELLGKENYKCISNNNKLSLENNKIILNRLIRKRDF